MASYFDEADHRRLLAEYPMGEAFLAGPARLGRDELRALQERRLAKLQQNETDAKLDAEYERARSVVVELVNQVQLNANRVDSLVEQLLNVSRRLNSLEGSLLRLAEERDDTGLMLIAWGLSTSAAAYPTDIKPVFAGASADRLHPQRVIDEDRIIKLTAASETIDLRSHATAIVVDEQPHSTPASAVNEKPVERPAPAASGFFASLLEQVPHPSVFVMLAMGAALCRFGSAYLGIRR